VLASAVGPHRLLRKGPREPGAGSPVTTHAPSLWVDELERHGRLHSGMPPLHSCAGSASARDVKHEETGATWVEP
jgi:hypothetical protein